MGSQVIRISEAAYQALKAEALKQKRTMIATMDVLLTPTEQQRPERTEHYDGVRVTYGISRTDARDLTYEDEK